MVVLALRTLPHPAPTDGATRVTRATRVASVVVALVLVGDVNGGAVVLVPGSDIPRSEFTHPRFRIKSVG